MAEWRRAKRRRFISIHSENGAPPHPPPPSLPPSQSLALLLSAEKSIESNIGQWTTDVEAKWID